MAKCSVRIGRAGRLAVSGNDTSRVFQIGSGVAVSIDGLTVTHGHAVGQGGGIFNGGSSRVGAPSLTLQRSLIALNRADGGAGNGGSAGSGQGGGLYLTPGGDASADLLTAIFANDASTSDHDVCGSLGKWPVSWWRPSR